MINRDYLPRVAGMLSAGIESGITSFASPNKNTILENVFSLLTAFKRGPGVSTSLSYKPDVIKNAIFCYVLPWLGAGLGRAKTQTEKT